MDRREKLLLLELILKDLHGAWGCEAEARIRVALKLAHELELEVHVSRLAANECDDPYYFQVSYRQGGYVDMDRLHGLDYSPIAKSWEFLEAATRILQHPERALHVTTADARPSPEPEWECVSEWD
jgi:hypothetical protein